MIINQNFKSIKSIISIASISSVLSLSLSLSLPISTVYAAKTDIIKSERYAKDRYLVKFSLDNNISRSMSSFNPKSSDNNKNILKIKINSIVNKLAGISLSNNNNLISKNNLIYSQDINIDELYNDNYIIDLKNVSSKIDSSLVVEQLKQDKDIEYITLDRHGYFELPEDPIAQDDPENLDSNNREYNHSDQWDEFNAPAGVFLESKPNLNDGAWQYSQVFDDNSNPVVVAVLDTGIETNTNLINNVILSGWNFAGNNSDLSDETMSDHGTHVAGTIAAHGEQVKGLAPFTKILPVKIPDESGMFYESNVIKAIYWASGAKLPGVPVNNNPAKVINMSFGIDEYEGKETEYCSPAVQDAVDYAYNKGVILVVAAGNSNKDHDLGSPGSCNNVVRVASTGPTGLRSYFSNYGSDITFAAPGGDKKYGLTGAILSTVRQDGGLNNTGLDFYQGTSMAAPHVAGLAAFIYSLDPYNKLTSKDVIDLMKYTTHSFRASSNSEDSCVGEKSCGHGIINANNAASAVLNHYDIMFSSPRDSLLELKLDDNCRDNFLIPSKEILETAEGTWELNPETLICQSKFAYSTPQMSFDNNGMVTATYGQVEYKLRHNLSNCKQIGYDGVGCYY